MLGAVSSVGIDLGGLTLHNRDTSRNNEWSVGNDEIQMGILSLRIWRYGALSKRRDRKAQVANHDNSTDRAEPSATHVAEGSAPRFDRGNKALITLAILAVLFALQVAAKFVIPVVISVLMAYALNPLVTLLERGHIPRLLGTLAVLGALVLGSGYVVYALSGQAQAILTQAPSVVTRLSRAADAFGNDGTSLSRVRKAAEALQKATDQATGATTPSAGSHMIMVQPHSTLKDLVMAGGLEIAAFAGQATMVIFLVFFLLLADDKFKRKFVKVAGRTISEKKITVQMFEQINLTIQRYLVMLAVANISVSLVSWLLFRMLGLNNAGTWALAAGVLHLIPYFGPLLIAIATATAAFMQFGTLGMAVLIGAVSLGVAAFIGILLTTWMTGRLAQMNTVAVFLSLLLFGFIWGVWGALLSVPIAVIVKVVSDHIEGMEAIAEFLGE